MSEASVDPSNNANWQVALFGRIRVVDGRAPEHELELTPIQRRLLAALAAASPRSVPIDELMLIVWGGDAPATARTAVANQISRLRSRCGNNVVLTRPNGYTLGIRTDLDELVELIDAGEAGLSAGQAADAWADANHCLARMVGVPFEGMDEEFVASMRRRMTELTMAAENLRLSASMHLGRSAWAVREAERLVGETPLDEWRWSVLVRALDAVGRRGDALAAVGRARRLLVSRLGLGPGTLLQSAETAVLGAEAGEALRSNAALIDRETQLELLADAVLSARSVVVTGENGSGKSSMLAAVTRRLRERGVRVAATRCERHPDVPTAVLDSLLDELGETLDSNVDAITGFIDACERVAARGDGRMILACVVDDVGNAGPTTRRALAAAAALSTVAVVAAPGADGACPDDIRFDEVIDLPGLGLQAIARIAADQLGRDIVPSGPIATWLAAMSGGNPLILDVLLEESLVDRALDAEPVAGSFSLGPAPGLREMVRRRLSGLAPDARELLELLAVADDPRSGAVISNLSNDHAVDAAVSAGLLVRDGAPDAESVRFRHGVVRRTVFEDLSPGHRVELHQRIAETLRSAGVAAATVAPHAVAAQRLDVRAAYEAAVQAAAEAYTGRAYAEAAAWYRDAAEAAALLGENGEVLAVRAMIAAGDAARLVGDAGQESLLFGAADAALRTGDPHLIGEAAFAALQLGVTAGSGAFHERAVRLAETALDIVVDPEQRARVTAAASLTYSMTGEAERCREMFLEAEAASTSVATRCAVLPFAYLALGHPSDLDLRERLSNEFLALAEGVDDPNVRYEALQLAFSVSLQRGDGPGLRVLMVQLRAMERQIRDVGRLWGMAYLEAALAHIEGDMAVAEHWSTTAYARFAEISPARAMVTHASQMLVIRMAQDRLGELFESLAAVVADQKAVPAWHAALALAHAQHDPEAAKHHARLVLDGALRDFTWLPAHVIAARAVSMLDDDDLNAEFRRRLDPWRGLVCWQGTCAFGPVATPLAALAAAAGDVASAEQYLVEGRSLAVALDAPPFAAELDAVAERWGLDRSPG